eukprot:TRINITY_DN3327_c0_g1_i1.p1 TRINITY_DN3327_c0_g1~~TRINITY_DN3327_c0_g1_i1.p1  ORF type:complete len:936 (-),score=264.84 TRINITY_DN3327_c0_g1_i1:441-3248(-)
MAGKRKKIDVEYNHKEGPWSVANSFEQFALDQVQEGMLLADSGRITFANKSFLALSGYPSDKLIGQSLNSVLPLLLAEQRNAKSERSTDLFLSFEDDAKKTKQPVKDKRFELVRSDHTVTEVFISFSCFSDTRITYSFREHSLLDSKKVRWLELHNEIIGASGKCVEFDKKNNDLILHYATKGTLHSLNLTEEAFGQSCTAMKIPMRPLEIYKELEGTNGITVKEHTLEYGVDDIRVLRTYFKFISHNPETGNPIFYQAITDVTELKKAEEDIKKKQQENQTLFEFAALMKVFFDSCPLQLGVLERVENNDILFKFCNPATAKLFKKELNELIGHTHSDFGGSAKSKELWFGMMKQCEGKESVHFEFSPDTHTLFGNAWLRITVTHIGGNDFTYIAEDITETKHLQFQLQNSKDELEQTVKARTKQLEQALQVKTRFLAVMSHEIRTPLAGVMGMLSILSDVVLPLEYMEMVRTARVCGEQLMAIINDILDLSKMEEKRTNLEHNSFSLHAVIEESLEVVSFESEKKNLELICDMDTNLQDMIVGDQNRVRQILVNLLGNAVKFSFRGEIVIHASSEDVGRGKVKITFVVQDEGIGITEQAKEHMFEPFSQADSSVTRRYGGSGLGLSISKKLAELMGGIMSFESEPNKGSKFTFTIVVEKGNDALSAKPSGVLKEDIKIKNVAIVDPSSTLRRVLEKTLRSFGFSAVSFANATEALETLTKKSENGHLWCVLVDAKQGDEAIARLRGQFGYVIVMGYSMPKGDDSIIFLRKPIRTTSLFNRLFGRRSMEIQTQSQITQLPKDYNASSLKELKILMAEDNLTNQKVIKQLLIRMGCGNITIVDDGKKAFEAVNSSRYDVVLMDLMMPEMGGLESTEKIRQEVPFENQPVIIALTANVFEDDRRRCLQCGMNDVLTKPVNIASLQRALTNFKTYKT